MGLKIIVFSTLLSFGSCLIVPGEVTSILDTAFLPRFVKGSDSRIGFGFAFGPHADFQVMLELGPQTNTMNLTGQPFPRNTKKLINSSKKRRTPELTRLNRDQNREQNLESGAGMYFQNWVTKIKPNSKVVNKSEKSTDVTIEDNSIAKLATEKRVNEQKQPKPGYIAQFILDNLRNIFVQKRGARKMDEKKRSEDVKMIK